jgi:Acyl-CoA reductase (LuxC)
MTTGEQICAAIGRVRCALHEPLAPSRIAGALARTCERWRDRDFATRRATIARIATATGFSDALLDESLDALLAPFSADALADLASRLAHVPQVGGFIMAGNVAGAGLHELAAALVSGAGAVAKMASSEPHFFAAFARTLGEIDSSVGARIAVFTWSRAESEPTATLSANCDFLVAYGDDNTIAALRAGGARRLFGFGSRLSIAAVGRDALAPEHARDIARALARDITLFEQLGCLSPHQVFIEEDPAQPSARQFAALLAQSLDRLAYELPPPSRLTLQDAAGIRRVREIARWRAIGKEPVELFEGPALAWTVIFDRDAPLTASPGFRTVYVSAYRDGADLCARLGPAARAIEACAVAGGAPPGAIGAVGAAIDDVNHVCAPGTMQSPPLTWRHGGGTFLDFLTKPQ